MSDLIHQSLRVDVLDTDQTVSLVPEEIDRNFLSVWNTRGTRKGCRKAPRPMFLYFVFSLSFLVVFP